MREGGCLKSSAPDLSFAGFVRRAVDAIRVEVPWAYEALLGALGGFTTTVVVDGEPATVRAAPLEIVVDALDGASDVRCVTTTRAILRLIGGDDTLLDAVQSDRVFVLGGVDAILVWHDVLEAFLHGAVRAREFDVLLAEFRRR